MKIYEFVKKRYMLISTVLLLASIIPFVLLSFYSRPCADDFGYSISIHNLVKAGNANIFTVLREAFITDIKFYNSWQGLYTAAFLQSLQPGSFGEQYYFLTAVIMIAILFIASYYLIKSLYKAFEINYSVLFSSIILTTIFIHGIPSTVQGLYWYCGAADYIPFIVLNMINTALIINYYYNDKNTKLYIVLSILCSFLLSGGNHVNSFLNILILVVLCIVSLMKKKKYGVFLSLISAIVGFIIMLVAPGTRVRMNSLESQSVFNTVYATFFRFIRLVFSSEYLNVRFFIYLLLITFLVSHNKNNKIIRKITIHPILLFLLFCMFLCGMLAVPYFAMGTFGSGRLKNVIWIAFMIFAGIFWFYTLIWLSDRLSFIDKLLCTVKQFDKKFVVIVLSILIVFSSAHMFSIIAELKDGTAETFAKQYDQRCEAMLNHVGNDILVVEPLINSPNLKYDDITTDVNNWKNSGWSQYYGVQTVVSHETNK